MRTLFFAIALFLGSLTIITAQDFYLPISTKSETAKAEYYKGVDMITQARFNEGIAQAEKALEADPNLFMGYVSGYNIYRFFGPSEKAKEWMDKALAVDARKFNEAEKIFRQQLLLWQEDASASSEKNMKALVAAYPKTLHAYEWAAVNIGYGDGDMDNALPYTQKMVAINPNYAPAYNFLGYTYMGKKEAEMDKAKAAFEKYIVLAPEDANTYDSMAEYYMVNKDYAKSAEYYDKAAAMGMTAAKKRADKAREMMMQ